MSRVETMVTIDGREFSIAASVWYDAGCRTLRNGDPGWPEDGGIEDLEVFDEDGNDVTARYESEAAFEKLIDDAIWAAYSDEVDSADDGPEWDDNSDR